MTIVSFDGAGAGGRAMRLVQRLEHLAGESIPRVLDVGVDDNADPVVVIDFCGDAVASVLAAGVRLEAGELVTLAAPILAALFGLHDRGFAHGAVSCASIAVGANGRPLLLGCEAAIPIGVDGDRRDRDRRAGEDIRAFADLVDDLAEAVTDVDGRDRARRAADAFRSAADAPFSAAERSAAEVRLFEIAEPRPLTLVTRPVLADEDRTFGAARILTRAPGERRRDRSRAREGGTDRRAVATLRQAVGGRVHRFVDAGVDRVGLFWGRASGRRRRILAAGASGAALALVLVLVIPTGDTTEGRTATAHASGTAMRSPTALASASTPSLDSTPSPDPSPSREAGGRKTSDADPRADDDAVAGTRAAVDVITACLVESVEGCWDEAFEPHSEILSRVTADPSVALPSALHRPSEGLEITEREDFGDARLVALTPTDETTPASVLVVRTEAGWRIREVFET